MMRWIRRASLLCITMDDGLALLRWSHQSLQAPSATASLTVPPFANPFMMKDIWRVMLCFYLGAAVHDVLLDHKFATCGIRCNDTLDFRGHHEMCGCICYFGPVACHTDFIIFLCRDGVTDGMACRLKRHDAVATSLLPVLESKLDRSTGRRLNA